MTKLLNRLFRRRSRQPREYHYLLHSPAGRFVSLTLAGAVKEHATRITYGLPPGIALSDEDKARIRADYDQMQKEMWSAMELNVSNSGTPAWFRRRDDLPVIPCWREINAQRIRDDVVPTWCYAYVPQILFDSLVALGGNEPPEGGTEEWIEYSDFCSDDTRQFVRVRLWFEENNSITVELLETRRIQKDTAVWWRLRRA
jgi:hypothetical protein